MMDFIRIACAVPPVKVANPQANAGDICNYIVRADEQGVDVLTFPELALTGYTCGDLFFQKTLLQSAMEGLKTILDCSRAHPAVTVAVGLPVLILSLFWRRFTFQGAVVGIIVGALADIGWLVWLKSTGIYEIIPGFLLGLAAAVVASLLSPKPDEEVTALFDAVDEVQ